MRGLPRQAKGALEKARDSGTLAVEVYNKPAVKFKSGGYITLMVIAWTSLFHAVFFKRKLKPFYRKESGRFVKLEGDYKYWELDECLNQYFKTDTGNPVRKNLEFFIPLRNKIEHRSMPELDASIFGECQAMLLDAPGIGPLSEAYRHFFICSGGSAFALISFRALPTPPTPGDA
jgi:uncharacterized protein DUF3644